MCVQELIAKVYSFNNFWFTYTPFHGIERINWDTQQVQRSQRCCNRHPLLSWQEQSSEIRLNSGGQSLCGCPSMQVDLPSVYTVSHLRQPLATCTVDGPTSELVPWWVPQQVPDAEAQQPPREAEAAVSLALCLVDSRVFSRARLSQVLCKLGVPHSMNLCHIVLFHLKNTLYWLVSKSMWTQIIINDK